MGLRLWPWVLGLRRGSVAVGLRRGSVAVVSDVGLSWLLICLGLLDDLSLFCQNKLSDVSS